MPSPLRASFLALALFTFVAGCDEEETEPTYLGVIDGSAAPDSAQPDASPDAAEVGKLAVSACEVPALLGADPLSVVRFAAAWESRLLLTVHDGVTAYELGPDACPGATVSAFGQQGHVALDAVAAVPLAVGRAIVATPDRTVVLESTGVESASCRSSGADTRLRWLASRSGEGWGVFVRSPIAVLTTPLGSPACDVDWIELEASPAIVLAISPLHDDAGFVAVEQQTASSPIAVSRYDHDGKRTVTSPAQAGAPTLCSVTGLVATQQGILVADGACKQLVLYDGTTLQAVGRAELDGSPRGLAWPGGNKVLVPVARATQDGAEATFHVVALGN